MEEDLCKKVAEGPVEAWNLPRTTFPVIALDVLLNLEMAKQWYGLDIYKFDYCIGISLGEYIAGCLL